MTKIMNEFGWWVLCPLLLTAGQFYVATDGDNGQDGSFGHPWQTVQYAVDHVGAGDTVNVAEGVYNELVTWQRSGEPGRPIVLRAASDARPVLDGTGLDADEMPALIKIVDQHDIVVKGFELRNLSSQNFASGVWVRGHARRIEIRDNVVHDISDPNPDGGAHGMAFYGTDGTAVMEDIIVAGNELHHLQLKWSEACAFNGNVRKFEVFDNVIHDVDNIGFVFIGFEGECADCYGGANQDRARDGRVYNNYAYNVDSRDNPPYNGERSAGGFYVDGGRDIIIEGNRATYCNIGIEVASEHSGKNAAGVVVRNNFIFLNHVAGLSTGGYDNSVGATDSCFFVNNSFYANHISTRAEDDWGAEILLNYHVHNNLFVNNIVYAAENYPRVLTVGNDVSGNTMDYNLYWGSNEGDAPGDHALIADPLYMDVVNRDWHISNASPAVDAGWALDSTITGSTDFDGELRVWGQAIDIGADETDAPNGLSGRTLVPRQLEWVGNFPNPFNPQTDIRYRLARTSRIQIDLFDGLGRPIRTLFKGRQQTGVHVLPFNAVNLASGVYFIRLEIPGSYVAHRMLLLK